MLSFNTRCLIAFMGVTICGLAAGCGLGDGDIESDGEPCVSDFDCPETHECVQAVSANASRVCMLLP